MSLFGREFHSFGNRGRSYRLLPAFLIQGPVLEVLEALLSSFPDVGSFVVYPDVSSEPWIPSHDGVNSLQTTPLRRNQKDSPHPPLLMLTPLTLEHLLQLLAASSSVSSE